MASTKPKSRRTIPRGAYVAPDGTVFTEIYCRRCMRMRSPALFYKAADPLDVNGLFSVCKDCMGEVFELHYKVHSSMKKAIFACCKIFNLAYSEPAVDAVEKELLSKELQDINLGSVFGKYKSKLTVAMKNFGESGNELDLTFHNHEPTNEVIENIAEDIPADSEYLEDFWGKGFSLEQYKFLEHELARYKKSHKSDTAAEESLLRLICFAEWEIRQARLLQDTPAANAGIKQLQELMKSASVQPSQANAAGAGKAVETFGEFIRIIEETEPAEYYQDKELFKDIDNLDAYMERYVTRPLSNFAALSRDFRLDVDEEDEDDDFVSIEELASEEIEDG